jgi:hypothetical protein
MARANTRKTEAERRRPGRPPIHAESWTKVTVVLFDRQIAFLDRIVESIRARSAGDISRAQLIRSMVDALSETDIDLTAATSEKDLKTRIRAHFR